MEKSVNLKDEIYYITSQIHNKDISPDCLKRPDKMGRTVLHKSCELGLVEISEQLIELGCDIDFPDYHLRTPLMYACLAGKVEAVKLLLKRGSRPDLKDSYGNTPLFLSIRSGNLELFEIFVNTNETDSETSLGRVTPLAVASFFGQTKIVQLILDRQQIKLDAQLEYSGMTPLMLAIAARHPELSNSLIRKGANKSTKNSYGHTPSDLVVALNMSKLLGSVVASPIWSPSTKFCLTPKKCIKRTRPLTPNFIYRGTLDSSPRTPVAKKTKEGKENLRPIKASKMRSKSASRHQENKRKKSEPEEVLESILKSSNLTEYIPIFKEQEIDFDTFLSLTSEDLKSIGIGDEAARSRILKNVEHYRVFTI